MRHATFLEMVLALNHRLIASQAFSNTKSKAIFTCKIFLYTPEQLSIFFLAGPYKANEKFANLRHAIICTKY